MADILSNKKLYTIVTELFIRRKKTKHSKHFSYFITQCYFAVPKILDYILYIILS